MKIELYNESEVIKIISLNINSLPIYFVQKFCELEEPDYVDGGDLEEHLYSRDTIETALVEWDNENDKECLKAIAWIMDAKLIAYVRFIKL